MEPSIACHKRDAKAMFLLLPFKLSTATCCREREPTVTICAHYHIVLMRAMWCDDRSALLGTYLYSPLDSGSRDWHYPCRFACDGRRQGLSADAIEQGSPGEALKRMNGHLKE